MKASFNTPGAIRAPIFALIRAALACGLLAVSTAQAAVHRPSAAAESVPPSQSVEQANATLERVARERAAVNEEFAASERVCYGKFFVNNCLDQAKEKRRAALAGLRAVEVEAEHFKRADSVEKRDAELAERARKDQQDQEWRAQQPAKPAKVEGPAPRPPTPGPSLEERQAQHDARVKRQAAQDAAGAAKRAANVIALENKKAEALRRQAEVARKMEENAKKQAARDAAEQKKAEAAKQPPAPSQQ